MMGKSLISCGVNVVLPCSVFLVRITKHTLLTEIYSKDDIHPDNRIKPGTAVLSIACSVIQFPHGELSFLISRSCTINCCRTVIRPLESSTETGFCQPEYACMFPSNGKSVSKIVKLSAPVSLRASMRMVVPSPPRAGGSLSKKRS